jgi:hypothetical protein
VPANATTGTTSMPGAPNSAASRAPTARG